MRRLSSLLAALAVLLGAIAVADARAEGDGRPNLIVIMTDDQTVESMRFMPKTRHLLGDNGVTFTNSFVSYPLCCPSRATLLTGLYAHNHGVKSNFETYPTFDQTIAALPLRLQAAGYRTIHVGKYLNGYGLQDQTEIPLGWSSWNGLVDPTTYAMYGYLLNRNGIVTQRGTLEGPERARDYQTDVLSKVARAEITASEEPFFLNLAFLAPHGETALSREFRKDSRNPRSARRHAHRFAKATAPRTASFDEADVSEKVATLRRLREFGPEQARTIDDRYRSRARALLAVDEAVEDIVGLLDERGILDDTMIVFTSDNGFLQGEHRITYGKYHVYEPSIRVPLIIRGPGVASGATTEQEAVNVDLAPTLLTAAGLDASDLDGMPLQPFLADPTRVEPRAVLLETYVGDVTLAEAAIGIDRVAGEAWTPYLAVRTSRYVFVDYITDEFEMYDLATDPDQTESVVEDPRYAPAREWLREKLHELVPCAGPTCRLAGEILVPPPPPL